MCVCILHTAATERYIHPDNLIIVSAFVYFSPSINWPTCNLLLKLIFSTGKHEIRYDTYCVFYAIKFAHFAFFPFSLHLSRSFSWYFLCPSDLLHIREHIIVGWLSAFLLQPVIWLAFSLLARVKIYWAARVYNVKMVSNTVDFSPFIRCNTQPSHSLILSFSVPNEHIRISRHSTRCPNRKIKFSRYDRWIIQVLYSNYMYSHYVAWPSHSQCSAECKM